jgi:glycosyltransferase involved in cell wall biosynthesis
VKMLTASSRKFSEKILDSTIREVTALINESRIDQAALILKDITDQEVSEENYAQIATIFNDFSLKCESLHWFEKSLWARKKCLDYLKDVADLSVIANSLEHLAYSELKLNLLDEAKKHLLSTREIYLKLGDELSLSRIIQKIGRIETRLGNYQEARKLFEENLTLAESAENQEGIASSNYQLGKIEEHYGDYNKAKQRYSLSLELSKKMHDKLGIAHSLHQLGVVEQSLHNFDEAKKLYEESLEIKKKLDDRVGIASALHQLGIIRQYQGKYDEASKFYQESLEIKKSLGDQRGIANSLHQLGRLEQARANYDEAKKLYRESLEIRKKLDDPLGVATTLFQLGSLKEDQGNYDEAKKLYRESLEIKKTFSDQTCTEELQKAALNYPQYCGSSLMSQVELSFVIPAYNEENFIEETLETIDTVLKDKKLPFEIVVVDDGSKDETLKNAQKYAGRTSHVKIVSYSKNAGKGFAEKTGFMESSGNIVIFADGDMEVSLRTVSEYLEALKYGDIVIASRRHINSTVKGPFYREFLIASFNWLVRFLTGVPLKDTQSGVKAMKKNAFVDIFPRLAVKRYAFDVELLAVANLYGLKIVEMPVSIKLDTKFKPKEMWHMFLDLLGIAYRLRVVHWYQRFLPEKNSFQNVVSLIIREH